MSGLQYLTSNTKDTPSDDGSLKIRRSTHGDRLINSAKLGLAKELNI